MTAPDRARITWRQASVADCLSVAEVNIRSLRESFAGRSWSPDPGDLLLEQRAAMFRRRFDDPFYRMHVAEAEGQGVVGFVDVGRPRETRWNCDAELYAIYVLKAYQRNGVGRRLFELACDAVQAEGLQSMCLSSPGQSLLEILRGPRRPAARATAGRWSGAGRPRDLRVARRAANRAADALRMRSISDRAARTLRERPRIRAERRGGSR